jgi:hypothetical protein
MSIGKRHKMIVLGAMLPCLAFCSFASSRPWKPTPNQIAADYASINHNKGNGDFVTIGWWSAPTARPGTQLIALFEKYVLISVTHSRINFNQPAAGLTFDDIKTLEARDQTGSKLSPSQETHCRPQASNYLWDSKRGIAVDLGRAAPARDSSCSMPKWYMLAKKGEFPFHTMARSMLGIRHFPAAHSRVLWVWFVACGR